MRLHAKQTVPVPEQTSKQFRLMIASRSREALDTMADLVNPFIDAAVMQNHICNGHADPLHGVTTLPDLLLFWISDSWRNELGELMQRPANQRPPMLIIGAGDDPAILRMAMKAGAMDYFKTPFDTIELLSAVRAEIDRRRALAKQHSGTLTAVINAKGGAGGSFIACNIAHIMRELAHVDVALVGMDIQFGSLSSYLDMEPEYGLIEALAHVDGMDHASLRGFMTKHSSGLHVLDVKPGELLMPQEIDASRLPPLLDVMLSSYDQVVVDLPRQIDELTSIALERADRILLVLQQNVAHLRDAQRLIKMLQNELHIGAEHIAIVVNRYDRDSEMNEASIAKSLGLPVALTIPNAFEQVNECINGGELIYAAFKRAPVTRAMMKIGETLAGDAHKDRSLLGNLFSKLRGA